MTENKIDNKRSNYVKYLTYILIIEAIFSIISTEIMIFGIVVCGFRLVVAEGIWNLNRGWRNFVAYFSIPISVILFVILPIISILTVLSNYRERDYEDLIYLISFVIGATIEIILVIYLLKKSWNEFVPKQKNKIQKMIKQQNSERNICIVLITMILLGIIWYVII